MLISVIMPTYNPWDYIFNAIDSILNQSFKDFELLIIDDWSDKVDLQRMLKDYIDSWKLKYFKKKNEWPWLTRNFWASQAKWDFLAFLDDDDERLPTKLEKQIAVMLNWKLDRSYDAVFCRWIRKEWEKETLYWLAKNNTSISDIINDWVKLSFNTVLVKKEIFLKLWGTWEHSYYWEDILFTVKLLANNYNIYSIEVPQVIHNVRENSLTTTIEFSKQRVERYMNLNSSMKKVLDTAVFVDEKVKNKFFTSSVFWLAYNQYWIWDRINAFKNILFCIRWENKIDYYVLLFLIFLPLPSKTMINLKDRIKY